MNLNNLWGRISLFSAYWPSPKEVWTLLSLMVTSYCSACNKISMNRTLIPWSRFVCWHWHWSNLGCCWWTMWSACSGLFTVWPYAALSHGDADCVSSSHLLSPLLSHASKMTLATAIEARMLLKQKLSILLPVKWAGLEYVLWMCVIKRNVINTFLCKNI